jgi:PAS domain S-box-containing protein
MVKSSTARGSERLQEQLNQVQRQLAGSEPIRRRQLADALGALQEALQEVETAEEELSAQNEELTAVREALEIERHRYFELFERAPVGYIVTDGAGTIREANRAAAALLNASQRALQGKPLPVFLSPSDRGGFRDLVQEMQTSSGVRELEIMIQPRNVSPRRVSATVARDAEKAGVPLRLRWVLQDISERRATEAALLESQERLRHAQRLEAIGRLAGGVAHSFNNLLAAIAFHSELILDDRCTEKDRKRHAEEIQQAGERAAALSRQLLVFSRKQDLNPEPVRLSRLVDGMEPMLHRVLGEDIEIEIAEGPDAGLVHADLGQLEQVFLNLVSNARDAMQDGGRLSIRTAALTLDPGNQLGLPPGRYVTLAIGDTGTGMSPEIIDRLFEPFFTTKEKGKGTGLGLSTAYGIIRQSGGDIRVESAPGQGSTFTILLPEVDPGAIEVPRRRAVERLTATGSEVILLVEDEDNIREPATEILEAQGYTVVAARNGAEALEIAGGHPGPIHLLITDVVMPRLSGSRLAEALTSTRPATRVLYISGYPEDAIAHHGVLEPRHRFLQKPFPPSVLLTAVRDVLESAWEPAADRPGGMGVGSADARP